MDSALDLKKWHAKYQDAPSDTKAAIDAAFDKLARSLMCDGFKTAGNDAAEELIAAIMAYVSKSNT